MAFLPMFSSYLDLINNLMVLCGFGCQSLPSDIAIPQVGLLESSGSFSVNIFALFSKKHFFMADFSPLDGWTLDLCAVAQFSNCCTLFMHMTLWLQYYLACTDQTKIKIFNVTFTQPFCAFSNTWTTSAVMAPSLGRWSFSEMATTVDRTTFIAFYFYMQMNRYFPTPYQLWNVYILGDVYKLFVHFYVCYVNTMGCYSC